MKAYILSNKNTYMDYIIVGTFCLLCGALALVEGSYSQNETSLNRALSAARFCFFSSGCFILPILIKYLLAPDIHLVISSSSIYISKNGISIHIPWKRIARVYISENNHTTLDADRGPYLHIICKDKEERVFSLNEYKRGYNSYQLIRAIEYYSNREDIIQPSCEHLWLLTSSNPFVNSIKEYKSKLW